jgi:hypothetical protein
MVPVNRQRVSSEGKQRIESRLMADSSPESGGDQFLRDDINWSDRPREIVDYGASRCKLPVGFPILAFGEKLKPVSLPLEFLGANHLYSITYGRSPFTYRRH